MKILQKNGGPLTDFEVFQLLRSRGATSDPLGCLGSVAASECKVYDYLVRGPAYNQTGEHVDELLRRCKSFELSQAEKLNIINLRPSALAVIYPIIEHLNLRYGGGEKEARAKIIKAAIALVEGEVTEEVRAKIAEDVTKEEVKAKIDEEATARVEELLQMVVEVLPPPPKSEEKLPEQEAEAA